jgi:DNA polymerase-3 subunit epsilon
MIVIDIETTGLDPQKNSIVSIGAIYFFNPEKTFYEECRIFDGAEINKDALNVNGFSIEEITSQKKPPHFRVLNDFLEWSENFNERVLAGHNVHFDYNFLKNQLEMYNLRFPFSYRVIDLHSIFCSRIMKGRGEIPNWGFSLDEILNYVGLPSEPKPHNALNGAKFLAEALSRIILGEKLLKDFENYFIPSYLF